MTVSSESLDQVRSLSQLAVASQEPQTPRTAGTLLIITLQTLLDIKTQSKSLQTQLLT